MLCFSCHGRLSQEMSEIVKVSREYSKWVDLYEDIAIAQAAYPPLPCVYVEEQTLAIHLATSLDEVYVPKAISKRDWERQAVLATAASQGSG